METTNCNLREAGSRMSGRRHLAVAVLALLFQLVPPLLLWAIATAVYVEPRSLPDAWERPLSLATLGFSAGVSLLLGIFGVYLLLRRAPLKD